MCQSLASASLDKPPLLWKLRPKLHYLQHLHDETLSWLNSVHVANFLDEDNMKTLRGLCTPVARELFWSDGLAGTS